MHINKTNGKRYVGITSLDVQNRWRNGNGYKTQVFGRAISKYGWDGFEHEILYDGLSLEDAAQIEKRLISEWSTQNMLYGYNVTEGGNGISGFRFSEQSKIKMSESAKHRNICYSERKKHPPISEETRAKMSNNNKGSGNPNYGRKHTDEELQKMSKAHSKKVAIIGEDGGLVKVFESTKKASEYIGVHNSVVAKCCRGLFSTCGGYKVKYV